jgi:type IV secretory pathway VirB2 component (pilin)
MKTLQPVARVSRPAPRLSLSGFVLLTLLMIPLAAHAQSGSPFDSGLTSLQNLFTGTVAKVASLIAIVIGGHGFAHGEPGAKKTTEVCA